MRHRQRLKPSCSAPLRPCPKHHTAPRRGAGERAREGSGRPPVRPQALRAIGFATSQSDRAPERDLHFFQYIFRDTYARARCSLLRAPLPSPVGAGRAIAVKKPGRAHGLGLRRLVPAGGRGRGAREEQKKGQKEFLAERKRQANADKKDAALGKKEVPARYAKPWMYSRLMRAAVAHACMRAAMAAVCRASAGSELFPKRSCF